MGETLWHPTSEVRLADPPVPAAPVMLRMLVQDPAGVELVYFGDRMTPAVRDGQRVTLRAAPPEPGHVVAHWSEGRLDLARVVAADPNGFRAIGDSETGTPATVPAASVAGVVDLPKALPGRWKRALRAVGRDLRELRRGPDGEPSDRWQGSSRSVRDKYDAQAERYAEVDAGRLPEGLVTALRGAVHGSGPVVVVGSGTGRECFQLEAAGLDVVGLDYSQRMTELAVARAAERGSSVRFRRADVLDHDEPAGTVAAVVFTYSVYSFLRGRGSRIDALARMRRWLAPDGTIWLSAWCVDDPYRRGLLTVGRLVRGGEWGETHTRWHGEDGRVRRSFKQAFTRARLAAEVRAAGLRVADDMGSHWILHETT